MFSITRLFAASVICVFAFAQATPSPQAAPAGIREVEVSIGKAPWVLPGTLAMPNDKGPFPLLVLVHASGPYDRDETIAACKPFRDLAWGLAQRGIAVLRYDKRTLVHRAQVESLPALTVREECIDDAVQAAGLAKSLPMVDPKRIFVLGHGLGGYLLPRLAKALPEAAGFIGMAASARPQEDLVLEQLKRRGAPSIYKSKIELDLAKIKALGPGSPPSEMLLNAPASYWLDLKGYDPAKEAIGLSKPMLFLQGDKDYLVTLADFELWQKALGSRKNVQWKRYASLNHVFMAVEGASSGAEFGRPGQQVAPEVIRDLAAWIQGR